MDESKAFVSATQRWRPSKQLIITLVVIVVIAVLAAIGYFFAQRRHDTNAFNSAYKTGNNDMYEGKFTAALVEFKSVETDARTPAQKAELYGQMARAAASLGDTNQAVQDYSLEHRYDPSTIGPDAYALATIYQLSGQKQQAIAQFKLSIQYMEKKRDSQHNPRMTANLNGEISAMQGLLQQEEGQQ